MAAEFAAVLNVPNPVYSKFSLAAWLAVFFAVLAWSATGPSDRLTWWLEVLPALGGLVALAALYPRFRFTPLVAWLILAHAVILMVGGRYTYAEVPLGFQAMDWFGWERNNYDKLGHFAQGFVPALIAREVLLRLAVVTRRGWLALIVVSICMAIAAVYELVEWLVALLSEQAAEAFLGTQGYVWDTQADMAWALAGALAALALLGRRQDRELARLPSD